MGVVYEAEDELLKNKVAIKTIRKGMSLSHDLIVRFQKEANALAALKHPNLVPLFVFGLTQDNEPYMVMRYEEGQPLSQLIEGRGYLPLYKGLNIFIQVAEAMQHAHKHGILHRDLKPANIMIRNFDSSNPDIVIIDFGIAMMDEGDAISTLTKTGVIVGTPSYMSPEQVRGRNIDERSDIYALGCIMFETLTGRKPYTAESSLELLSQKINVEAPKINSVDRELRFPAGLEEIVATALALSADERYQSMDEFRNDLISLKTGEYKAAHDDSSSHSVGEIAVAQKPLETKYLIAGLAAVGIAAVCVAVFMFNSLGSKVEKDRTEELVSIKEISTQMTEPFAQVLTLDTPQMSGESLHARVQNALKMPLVHDDMEAKEYLDAEQKKRDERKAGIEEPIELLVDCNHITGKCFEGCRLPIVALSINRCGTTPAGLKAISQLPHLVHLHLSAEDSLGDGLGCLADSNSLEIAQIASCSFIPESLEKLASSKKLKILRLLECKDTSNHEFTGRAMEYVSKGGAPNLKQLYWSKMRTGGNALAGLKSLPELRQLSLIRNDLRPIDLPGLADLQVDTLKILGSKKIGEKDLKPLESMKNLTILVLREDLRIELIRRYCPKLGKKQIRFDSGHQDNYPDIRTGDADLLDADYFGHEGGAVKTDAPKPSTSH